VLGQVRHVPPPPLRATTWRCAGNRAFRANICAVRTWHAGAAYKMALKRIGLKVPRGDKPRMPDLALTFLFFHFQHKTIADRCAAKLVRLSPFLRNRLER